MSACQMGKKGGAFLKEFAPEPTEEEKKKKEEREKAEELARTGGFPELLKNSNDEVFNVNVMVKNKGFGVLWNGIGTLTIPDTGAKENSVSSGEEVVCELLSDVWDRTVEAITVAAVDKLTPAFTAEYMCRSLFTVLAWGDLAHDEVPSGDGVNSPPPALAKAQENSRRHGAPPQAEARDDDGSPPQALRRLATLLRCSLRSRRERCSRRCRSAASVQQH